MCLYSCFDFLLERERLRRSTIRTLFEQLRQSIPAIEGQEGTSDRQILVEASKLIQALHNEASEIDSRIISAKEHQLRLKMELGLNDVSDNKPNMLRYLSEAAEIAQAKDEAARILPDMGSSPALTGGMGMRRLPGGIICCLCHVSSSSCVS